MIEASPLFDERKAALMNFIKSESERARQARKDDEAADSIEFYRGDKLGNEREGRSQVVTRDVAEVVDQALVNIMETMVSGDRVVTFEADEDEDAALGEGGQPIATANAGDEATEAVHYQFMRKQNGYRILHDALKAGLLEKIGVVKTFKEQKYQIERFDVPALALADTEFAYDWVEDVDGNPIDDGALIDDLPEIVSAYRRVALPPVIKDMTVPLEQFRISPDARDFESAALIGHDERVTLSDLRQMGFEVSETVYGKDNGSTLASTRDGGTIDAGWQEGAGRVVTLSEDYVQFDYNGDGITERLCVHYVGNDILSVEEVDQQPFSGWVPFPMQHRYSGEALADKAKSFQAINTQILRSGIDSLFSALNPRITVDEGSATDNTIDDLLQPDLNAIIRYRGVAPAPWKTDDTSVSAFGAMEFMLSQRDSVTGINRHSQGLNPDSLNKMLCVFTDIPMADGTVKKLGAIEDGDVIIGSDGKPVTVLKAHKAHLPERAYAIRFASGEVIHAGGEHLWSVKTGDDRKVGNDFRVVDTDWIAKRFGRTKNLPQIYIPRVERPQFGEHRDLPIDPYILGLWLGDGTSAKPHITLMDKEIVASLVEWADANGCEVVEEKHQNSGKATTYNIKGDAFGGTLRRLGLMRSHGKCNASNVKHIPEEYLNASYEQRLELLRGLMDTDGCHHSRGLVIFSQKAGPLVCDVFKLIEGLGGWPSVNRVNPGKLAREGVYYCNLAFSIADNPFRVSRKANKWRRQTKMTTLQRIRAIEEIELTEMRCLTVDAPDGLFCVGERFTVTHNTASGMAMLQDNADKVMKYLARNFAEMLVAPMFLKRYQLMRAFVQPFPMRIDGQRVMVTPSDWPHEIDMQINVGLGSNRREGRVQSKMTLAQIQREIASSGSRLVGEKEIFNTVKGIVRDLNVGGVPTDYVKDPDTLGPEADQPSEAEMKAQAEQAKSAAELQFKLWEAEQRFAIEREKIEREDARERDRMDREFALAAERLMQPEAPAYHPGGALDR